MRVLVTGGFGYLGSHVAERFRGAGDEVRLLGRGVHEDMRTWAADFDVAIADIADPRQLEGVCDGVDAVVHTVALNAGESAADPRRSVEVTGLGTRYLLDEAARAGVGRFVYLSTMHVYGSGLSGPVDEMRPTCAANDYAATHLLAEAYCREAASAGLSVAIARPSNGYGAPVFPSAHCWMLSVNDFARQAVRGGSIVLNTPGIQLRDFIEIRDMAAAIEHLARVSELPLGGDACGAPGEQGIPAVFNIGGDDARSIRDAASVVAQVSAERFDRHVEVEAPAPPPDAQTPEFSYSARRLRETGFEPAHSFEDGVEDLIRFVADMDR